jgi:tRNA 5-methylaminomethyl-2-thiouridine biosynthesis bifunctional protein
LPQLAGDWPPPRTVLCRSGYLAPLMNDGPDGGFCVGASFDRDDNDLTPRMADHAGNLQRLEELLPGTAQGIDAGSLRGRVGIRTATRDRLPLVGPLPAPLTARQATQVTPATLPRLPGLHALLGLGARGMVWAPLAAEHLASQLCGEPSPLERPLARLLDPARFYLHALRRSPPGGDATPHAAPHAASQNL